MRDLTVTGVQTCALPIYAHVVDAADEILQPRQQHASVREGGSAGGGVDAQALQQPVAAGAPGLEPRSEEHTSELQSQSNLVCRLLPVKKKYRTRIRRMPV